jgi:membrane fusion protein, heavy metal efflux system
MRVLAILALVVGCRGKADDGVHEPAEAVEHGSGSAAADRKVDIVKIEPEMMHDLRVTFDKATLHAAGEKIDALGEVHVNEDKYAEVAAPVTARVARVLAKPGDVVVAGQVLAELRSPELAQSRAEVDAAKAHLDVARANAERKRKLAEDRLIPEREKIEAEAQLTEAEAAYKVAVSMLRKYGGAEGETGLALKSPVAGTVIDRKVVVGQLADPSKTLFEVGDLSTLWLVAHVFERDAIRVPQDATATVNFAALPGKPREAKVKWIGREVDAASRTIAIRLEVENSDGLLRPGMTATISIPLGEPTEQAICVPAAAVQRVGGGWVVFVPKNDHEFAIRPVGRGRDMDGAVEVMSGLAPNETVVVGGAFLLKAEADKARGGALED